MADGLKLLTKELIMPTAAAKGLFYVWPCDGHHAGAGRLGGGSICVPTLHWPTSMPGILLVMAITSIEVYGVIIAGWASNSKYAFLGALACVRHRW